MSGSSIQQMAGRVADLLESRLNVRGASLSDKLRRGGRRLPSRVRQEAEYLARAAEDARAPKRLVQVDHERVARAYDTCVRYLGPLGRAERRRAIFLDMITGIGGAVFVTLALLLGVLVWRGFL